MSKVIIDKNYKSKLGLLETEVAIKFVKDTFERELAKALNLTRVSAPLFVLPETGLNDDLNGYERPVSFDIHDLRKNVQIVQSLAKWKRNALRRYGFNVGEGLYTDMNAIRRDEELDNFHSVYVDQWDWERIITRENRNMNFLKQIVKKIYKAICNTQTKLMKKYPILTNKLPKDIKFIKSTDLYKMYPDKTPKERETIICKEYGAVFISQIGWPIDGKEPHDGRAADYDDWKLNGDILVYFEVLDCALELSSMGIRVDEKSLREQLAKSDHEDRLMLQYDKMLINGELPLTIGGGIGQSRLCMLLLNKAHVGEVQASIWPEEMIEECNKNDIHLL